MHAGWDGMRGSLTRGACLLDGGQGGVMITLCCAGGWCLGGVLGWNMTALEGGDHFVCSTADKGGREQNDLCGDGALCA